MKVSVEKDEIAHKTLSLRALFRAFRKGAIPDCYYDYVRGDIPRAELFAHRSIPEDARVAASEARCAELGVTPHKTIDGWIRNEHRVGFYGVSSLVSGPAKPVGALRSGASNSPGLRCPL